MNWSLPWNLQNKKQKKKEKAFQPGSHVDTCGWLWYDVARHLEARDRFRLAHSPIRHPHDSSPSGIPSLPPTHAIALPTTTLLDESSFSFIN